MKGAPLTLTVDTGTGRIRKESGGEIGDHEHGAEREGQDTIDEDHMIEVDGTEVGRVIVYGGAEVGHVIVDGGGVVGHMIEEGGVTHGDLVPYLGTDLEVIHEGEKGGLKERRRDHPNQLYQV